MAFLALLTPTPIIENLPLVENIETEHRHASSGPGARQRTIPQLVLAIAVIIAVAWSAADRVRDNQRSNACTTIDTVRNIDTQPNFDCFEE